MVVYKHHQKWSYDFQKTGQRYRKGGYITKKDAVEAEAKARMTARMISTDFIKLCEARLEDLEVRRSRKHFRENQELFKNLIVIWGYRKEITRTDVENYLTEIAKQSKQKANKQLRYIKALFNYGVQREWLTHNPASRIQAYGVEPAKRYIPPIEDIMKVLQSANEEQRRYLLAIIYTMGRVRELNNLKWDDIKDGYLILKTRKAKNSNVAERKIPFTESLKEILDTLPRTSDYAFPNPKTGTRYDYRKFLLRGLCKRAQVKPFTFHCLRHYGASKLSNAGVALTDIQNLLGHQRATTTDIYLQSLTGSLEVAIKNLELPTKIHHQPEKGRAQGDSNT